MIEERSDQIIKESSKVKDTLSWIEMQANNLAEATKHVGEQIKDVLVHSKSIFEQSKEIATTQAQLSKGQSEMREKIEAGNARVEESYERLGNGMDKLKEETGYVKREIKNVGESMSSKMQDLQRTADDIGVRLISINWPNWALDPRSDRGHSAFQLTDSPPSRSTIKGRWGLGHTTRGSL